MLFPAPLHSERHSATRHTKQAENNAGFCTYGCTITHKACRRHLHPDTGGLQRLMKRFSGKGLCLMRMQAKWSNMIHFQVDQARTAALGPRDGGSSPPSTYECSDCAALERQAQVGQHRPVLPQRVAEVDVPEFQRALLSSFNRCVSCTAGHQLLPARQQESMCHTNNRQRT